VKGFFSKREITARSNSGSQNLPPCERCKLYRTCETPKMIVTGKGRLKALLIGEAPGREEDEGNAYFNPGTQFIGQAGTLLRDKLDPFGIDLERDFWKINAVNCRPPKNKTPTRKQIKCCKEYYVDSIIRELNPKYIWLLGAKAVESFYVDRFSKLSMSRWRGLCIPDRNTKAWIMPMFHPSYLLRSKKKTKRGFVYYDKNIESVYDRDLENAVEWLNLERPKFKNYKRQVEIVLDIDRLLELFAYLHSRRKSLTAFDFETSALKPFKPIKKIWCMAIANKRGTFAFPIDYPHWNEKEKEIVLKEVKAYLQSRRIRKIAHNLKFEDVWSRVHFEIKNVYGWLGCTMNAAHIIDDRKDFTGLKFQSYINFGIEGYEKEVKPYMRTNPATGLNRLNELPIKKLLTYCGLDAHLDRKLHFKQRRIIGESEELSAAYKLTVKGLKAFADTQIRGFPVDELYYIEEDQSLADQIESIEKGLKRSKWSKRFKKKYKREINIDSAQDLIKLFRNVMKVKLDKKTEKGNYQMTAEVLESLHNSYAKKIVKLRKLKKIKNTYMAMITREIHDGRIHAFIDLHIPRSFRSSSSDPNLQNIPVREEEAKRAVRRGFIPEMGCKLLFFDYGSQEVRIIACYTHDENLIAYIEDPTTDMHYDQSKKIFVLDDDQATKKLRFYTKNQFVFPEFYGSYYKSCAKNLWYYCSELKTEEEVPVWKHLVNEGVISDKGDFAGFENHVKKVEENFWERFPQVREWQEQSIDWYQRHGYIKTFFGHQRRGLLTPNMIVNTPIQATAFHCLLWAYIKLNAYSKRRLKSSPIFQIHDEIVWNTYPKEEKRVIKKTVDVMENKIRERFDFLIVPLLAELEETEVDQSWYAKKELVLEEN
jgi:DNA polymerase-1